MYVGFSRRGPDTLFGFKLNFNFLEIFSKNSQIHVMKIHPVGAELFHAEGRTDRQTDMKKVIVAFWQYCERT